MGPSRKRFCAKESLQRKDAFLGTASVAACYLLVEYGEQWPSKVDALYDAAELGEAAAREVKDFVDWCPYGVRRLLVKGKDRHRPTKMIALVRADAPRPGGGIFELKGHGEISGADLRNAYLHPRPLADTLLVCTHGKRDKCCARYGFPLFRQLYEELETNDSDVAVWQCSHVGGDRFAANVIWLPYGLVFGRVHWDTDSFVEAFRQRRISLSHFRGTSVFPSAAQYLEGWLRKKWGLDRPGGVEMLAYSLTKNSRGHIIAEVRLRALAMDNPMVAEATVRIRQDQTTGSKVLASCNVDGYTYRRVFEFLHGPMVSTQ